MHTVYVHSASHDYPIHIGSGILQDFSLLQPYISKKVAIVTNETIAPLYLKPLQDLLNQHHIETFDIVLPDGEQYKSHESLDQIYHALLTHHADRKTVLIALGGGVIGDMVGFAAATYQRGVPFIQIPTTLLSQVDSSVGGKTAINHRLGKNMIGAFYQPKLVLADLNTLKTLPEREFCAGMAEVIKYGLLGDDTFFVWLEQHIDDIMQQQPETLAKIVAHCCQMKADIVAQDETEQGIRAHLNLGHTFGHAIEVEMGYGNWLHGEAVAAGVVLAGVLSEQLGYLKADDVERIKALLRAVKLPDAPPTFSATKWIEHMQRDKKVENGTMRFITLKQIGKAQISEMNDVGVLQKVLHTFTS